MGSARCGSTRWKVLRPRSPWSPINKMLVEDRRLFLGEAQSCFVEEQTMICAATVSPPAVPKARRADAGWTSVEMPDLVQAEEVSIIVGEFYDHVLEPLRPAVVGLVATELLESRLDIRVALDVTDNILLLPQACPVLEFGARTASTSSGQISSWRRLYSASWPGEMLNSKQIRSTLSPFWTLWKRFRSMPFAGLGDNLLRAA